MRYNGFGRQQRWVFPSKTTPGVADQQDYEQYLYDPAGNRVQLRKRDGQVLTYTYDALGRMVIQGDAGQPRQRPLRLRPSRAPDPGLVHRHRPERRQQL